MSDWEKNTRSPMRAPSQPSFAVWTHQSPPRPLEITVLHTNTRATVKALQNVARLSDDLLVDVRILVLQVVPYPLPIDTPDVPLDFTSQRLMAAVSPLNLDVRIEICVGRDKAAMLESALAPASLVVAGSRRQWWPNSENRIAKLLGRLGHQVVSADFE